MTEEMSLGQMSCYLQDASWKDRCFLILPVYNQGDSKVTEGQVHDSAGETGQGFSS